MRRLRGTLTVLCLLLIATLAGVARGQVSGQVESVGFDGLYRPTCWTPLLVKLKRDASVTSGTYELRVSQRDADGDFVLYTSRITLTGGAGEQAFWTYFLPQPVMGGLNVVTRQELQSVLRVTVHDPSGRELALLAMPAVMPQDIDPDASFNDPQPGRKLIVYVGEKSTVATEEFRQDRLVGTSESFAVARVTPDGLPESVLGFDSVDAVVWLDGNPGALRNGTRMDALREYVRRGGHLVVTTTMEARTLNELGDMLPADVTDVQAVTELKALRTLGDTRYRAPRDENAQLIRNGANPWRTLAMPIATARLTPRAGAIVEEPFGNAELRTIDWPDGTRTPWLVRRGFGYGCVSMVSQDLGNVQLIRATGRGWTHIWDAVLGTANLSIVDPLDRKAEQAGLGNNERSAWRADGFRNFGFSALRFLDLAGRSATLVTVAVVFFLGYWAIAGPGVYFFLRAKGRAQHSWFAFGALAVVATLLTLGLVRLVLSGSPQVRHLSFVRTGGVDPSAVVVSRIGMYVPRDGVQSITLDPGDATVQPTLSPYPRSPAWTEDRLMTRTPRTYTVDVARATDAAAPTQLDVFFRTTQKQFSARWAGPVAERISGDARVSVGKVFAEGQLTNLTGRPLRNVYVAFRNADTDDQIMYLPAWDAGATIDLGALWAQGDKTTKSDPNNAARKLVQVGIDASPGDRVFARGSMLDWRDFWLTRLGGGGLTGGETKVDDFADDVPKSVPILSLFGRIPPRAAGANGPTRVEVLRSGMRDVDVSAALVAGNLVVIAQADDQPLPLPLKVSGSAPSGSGRVVYQFVMPIDRAGVNAERLKRASVEPPTTGPSTQPAGPEGAPR